MTGRGRCKNCGTVFETGTDSVGHRCELGKPPVDEFDWEPAILAAREAAESGADDLQAAFEGLDTAQVMRDALRALGPLLPAPQNRASMRAAKRSRRKPGAPRQAKRKHPG